MRPNYDGSDGIQVDTLDLFRYWRWTLRYDQIGNEIWFLEYMVRLYIMFQLVWVSINIAKWITFSDHVVISNILALVYIIAIAAASSTGHENSTINDINSTSQHRPLMTCFKAPSISIST